MQPIHRFRILPLVLLACGIVATPGRGEVVILRDGYALHGKVGGEQTTILDPLTGESISVKKMAGLTSVDDGPRWTIFSDKYKQVGDVSPFNKFENNNRIIRQTRFGALPAGRFMTLQKETDFDARWKRLLVFRNPQNTILRYDIEQQIDVLTPHYTRVVSTSHEYTNYYLTKELGAERVRKLLHTHPDLQDEKGKVDAGRRTQIIRFLMQADWLVDAEEELDQLLTDLPGETKRVEELREEVRTLRLEKAIGEIEQAKEGARHGFAQVALKGLPREKIPAKLALKIASLRAEYETASEKLEKAKRSLQNLRDQVKAPEDQDLVQGAFLIAEELHLDTVSRLDLFIALAEQAESAIKQGKPATHKPEQLLAAAVCGWLMGNNSTETNVVTARKRLKARSIALEYLRDPSSPKRRSILTDYEKDAAALPFDELEKLISLLPPPEADKNPASLPIIKKTGRLPGLTGTASYLLQLPPEYQHHRPYPLLIVLPNGGEKMSECLKRMRDLPGKQGFIIAVLDWTNNNSISTYDPKDEELQLMMMGVLRHLRRTIQVDSDRIFLAGYGEGANMALDVGACHPSDYAGIIAICPNPDPYLFLGAIEQWKNYQNLPVYIVMGEKIGEPVKAIRNILTSWMPAGYPALCSIYKGRGFEAFEAEYPYLFDWMSRKKRATALPDLAKAFHEYRTVRASSNQFFWISSNDIDPRCVLATKGPGVLMPAKVHAHILEGNRIVVGIVGLRQMSIWLGRDSIDFAKPITVKIEDRFSGNWTKQLTPKIAVLLEDLYERGDRQRPYYQRIDCTDLQKTIKFSAQ